MIELDRAKSGNGAADVLAIIAGAVLFKLGFATGMAVTTFDSLPTVLAIWALYLSAFVLIVAGVSSVDVEDYHRELSLIAFGAIIVTAYTAFFSNTGAEYLGTDGILFARYSVDLLLNGVNPYAASMDPAFHEYPIDDRFVTYRVDGSIVNSISYPALSLLIFVPQALLGIPNLNLTTLAVFVIVVGYLLYETPNRYALAPIAVMFADPNLVLFSYGGVFDIVWVLPLLIGMRLWTDGRHTAAAFVIGLAFAVKQTPWFIAPFMAVWLYMEAPTLRNFAKRSRDSVTAGLTGFILPNLPFIIWGPWAWASSVLTPIAGGVALVKQGNGLTLISVAGVYNVPKTAFTVILIVVLLTLLVIYALYFHELKHAAWIMPAIVLWFNYRSLNNYFVFFIPVAYYAVLLHYREVETHA